MCDSNIIYLECPLGCLAESPQDIGTVITRNTDIISRATDYVVAIQRMRLSLSRAFNWAPTLLLGQSLSPPIQTIYRMVVSYDGTDGPIQFMDLVRTRLDSPVPPVPLAQQPSSLYASSRGSGGVARAMGVTAAINHYFMMSKPCSCRATIQRASNQQMAPDGINKVKRTHDDFCSWKNRCNR